MRGVEDVAVRADDEGLDQARPDELIQRAAFRDHVEVQRSPGHEDAGPRQRLFEAMMMGEGPYGPVEMGGMFSVLKVRRDQKPGDYADPGWYAQPAGTQAKKVEASIPPAVRAPETADTPGDIEVSVRKPTQHAH